MTWPRLTRGLAGFLHARGVPPCDVDDYVQEAVQRATSRHVTYDSVEELLAWCITVARNLVIDDARRSARRGNTDIGAPAATRDAEADVMARLAAFDLLDAFRALSEADREAITTRGRELERTEANRLAQRRTRARRRLRDSLLILLGGWAVTLRRAARTGQVAIVTAAVLTVGLAVPPPSKPQGQGPLPHRAPVEAHIEPAASIWAGRGGERTSLPPRNEASPARKTASPDQGRDRVVIEPLPGRQGVYLDQRPATDEDPLLCVQSVPIVGDLCTVEVASSNGTDSSIASNDPGVSIVG